LSLRTIETPRGSVAIRKSAPVCEAWSSFRLFAIVAGSPSSRSALNPELSTTGRSARCSFSYRSSWKLS